MDKNETSATTNRTEGWGPALVELMVVVAVIGLLAAIAIPNLQRARTTSQTNACINNLTKIDDAKQQWGMSMPVTQSSRVGNAELQPFLGRGSNGELPSCPLDPQQLYDSSYTTGNLGTLPVCKIAPSVHFLTPPAPLGGSAGGPGGGP